MKEHKEKKGIVFAREEGVKLKSTDEIRLKELLAVKLIKVELSKIYLVWKRN